MTLQPRIVRLIRALAETLGPAPAVDLTSDRVMIQKAIGSGKHLMSGISGPGDTMSRNDVEFFNFLGSWFPDSDLEGRQSDEDVVKSFVNTKNEGRIQQVRAGCDEILGMTMLPMEQIMSESNRHFDSEDQCRSWLLMLRSILFYE